MNVVQRLDRFHSYIRQNKWYFFFTIFTRLVLAAGFLPSGWVKVTGERFTALSSQHPLGAYLDAFYATGYYYTFVGVIQVLAAILLLIPRTALLGAMIYLPIIVNICVLSFAVRFDGSLFTSPLMVLACLYLFFWDYHKLKPLLGLDRNANVFKPASWKFPYIFVPLIFLTIIASPFLVYNMYEIMPKNTKEICLDQCNDSAKPGACQDLCNCVHEEARSWGECLEAYENAPSE